MSLKRRPLSVALTFAAVVLPACEPASERGGAGQDALANLPSEEVLAESLTRRFEPDLAGNIQILASDEFEGRGTASPEEERTMDFLVERFSAMGLEPGGENGTWFQEVPLVSITADPGMTLSIAGNGETSEFEYATEFVGWTKRVVEDVQVANSELVFVGYGAVAPEYGWDDYAGIDVTGKTVVVLVNDPGFATQDPQLFRGNAMTYYGRWTYKFEEGARQGAAAVLIVHETEPAAYGWATVRNGWTGPQFDLVREDDNMSRVAVEAWISLETARAIFAQAGWSYDDLKAQAQVPGFQAVPMGLTASLSIRNGIQRSSSRNFFARLPGRERPDEVVMYMGHWDHFGTDPALEGDQIYNGARDNASGIAAIMEIARAFQRLEPGPNRSVVFWATTGEEQGLLGSGYYAERPVYPLDKTVAAINIDALSIWGASNDYTIVGFGNSELDEYAVRANQAVGREVKPNPTPERGSFYRSDHFPLARQGVPAHYGHAGHDNVEHGEEWGRAQSDAWTAQHYHQVSDEYTSAWDFGSAWQDMQVWFRMGVELAYTNAWPRWNEGTEFKAIRDGMMRGN